MLGWVRCQGSTFCCRSAWEVPCIGNHWPCSGAQRALSIGTSQLGTTRGVPASETSQAVVVCAWPSAHMIGKAVGVTGLGVASTPISFHSAARSRFLVMCSWGASAG